MCLGLNYVQIMKGFILMDFRVLGTRGYYSGVFRVLKFLGF